MQSTTESNVSTGIQNAFDSSIYSDVTVHCQDKVFSVHKVILASQSPFFAAMLKDFKEGKSNIIELPDSEDDELVKAVLRFMYGKPLEIPSDYNAAPFLANLYGKADYYQLPALKQASLEAFKDFAHAGESGAKCVFLAAPIVYDTIDTDRAMKDVTVKVLTNHFEAIVGKDQKTQRILEEVPKLASDLIKIRCNPGIRCACPSCGFRFSLTNMSDKSHTDVTTGQIACPKCRTWYNCSSFRK